MGRLEQKIDRVSGDKELLGLLHEVVNTVGKADFLNMIEITAQLQGDLPPIAAKQNAKYNLDVNKELVANMLMDVGDDLQSGRRLNVEAILRKRKYNNKFNDDYAKDAFFDWARSFAKQAERMYHTKTASSEDRRVLNNIVKGRMVPDMDAGDIRVWQSKILPALRQFLQNSLSLSEDIVQGMYAGAYESLGVPYDAYKGDVQKAFRDLDSDVMALSNLLNRTSITSIMPKVKGVVMDLKVKANRAGVKVAKGQDAMKTQLIKLGSTNPELRPHIRAILSSTHKSASDYQKDTLSLIIQMSVKVNSTLMLGEDQGIRLPDDKSFAVLEEIDYRLDNAKDVIRKRKDVVRRPPYKFEREVATHPYLVKVKNFVDTKLMTISKEMERGAPNFDELTEDEYTLNNVLLALRGWATKG